MSLFGKRGSTPLDRPGPPRFGPGRRFESDQDLRTCEATLTAVLNVHAPAKYQHMPVLQESAVNWHGPHPSPLNARTFSDGSNDIFVLLFWAQNTGTAIGMFPLEWSAASLDSPLIGQWMANDPSLRSKESFDPGQFTLLAPKVNVGYFEDILRIGGKPISEDNVQLVAQQVALMFNIKATEYITKIDRDERAPGRFVDRHRWTGDISLPERILKDLGEWNYTAVPYLQELPARICGILLEPGTDGRPTGDIWNKI